MKISGLTQHNFYKKCQLLKKYSSITTICKLFKKIIHNNCHHKTLTIKVVHNLPSQDTPKIQLFSNHIRQAIKLKIKNNSGHQTTKNKTKILYKKSTGSLLGN